jgi:lactoylglutathione lyase
MKLGAFSISLVVKDLQASRDFYEALGFEAAGGEQDKGWLVMRDGGGTVIGLFKGMFERNMLTFNPGWDQFKQELPEFTDVRELQRQLKAKGIALTMETDESGKGPGYLMTVDPDGNPILIDQHV